MTASRLFIGIALLIAILATGWLHWGGSTPDTGEPRQDERLVESTLSNFVATAYATDGRMSHRLEANHMLRYADSNEAHLSAPRFTLASDDGPPWRIDAPWGHWQPEAENERLWLLEAVRIRRDGFAGQSALGIDTRDLLIRPSEDYAHSAAPSVLRSGTAHMRGTGLEFDFKLEKSRLLADVRGFYRDLDN